jgi:hypothetical protein
MRMTTSSSDISNEAVPGRFPGGLVNGPVQWTSVHQPLPFFLFSAKYSFLFSISVFISNSYLISVFLQEFDLRFLLNRFGCSVVQNNV